MIAIQSDTAPALPVALHALNTVSAPSFKSQAVRQLHLLSYFSGVSSIYARLKDRSARGSVASILMYHSIPSPHETSWIDPRNCLSAEQFEVQMRFLASHRHVISIDQLIHQLETGEPIRRETVAITFDDGYLNNLRVAAPILAKYGLPATLYLVTAYVNTSENQWIDTLYGAFRARSKHDLTVLGSHWNLAISAETSAKRAASTAEKAYSVITRHLIECTPQQRQQILQNIDEQLAPIAYPPRLTMNWNEVRELRQRYPQITLGVHTANHLDLRTHSDRTDEEIQLSTAHFLSEMGEQPQHFAFPYNRSNQAVCTQVAKYLRSAVAVADDPVVRLETSKYALPRLEAPQSLTLLKSWTNGGFPDVTQRLFGQVCTQPF
ncbi:MAG: polysaccharide deacetylase family protein [Phormidesmis sp.]